MSEEKKTTAEQTFKQLAAIKARLETYPMHEHQAVCLRDCMLLLIRTFAGEQVPELTLSSIGGGTMEAQGEVGQPSVNIGGELRKGGVEIAPGVVQYPAAGAAVTMDVEASERELSKSLAHTKAPPPDMPKPVAGSLMAQAMEAESENAPEPTIPGEASAVAQITGNSPAGIPSPSDTTVEITS
jgi:hypothetical protein